MVSRRNRQVGIEISLTLKLLCFNYYRLVTLTYSADVPFIAKKALQMVVVNSLYCQMLTLLYVSLLMAIVTMGLETLNLQKGWNGLGFNFSSCGVSVLREIGLVSSRNATCHKADKALASSMRWLVNLLVLLGRGTNLPEAPVSSLSCVIYA